MKKLLLALAIVLATTVMAKNFYLRTNSDATSWSNITMVPTVDTLITLPLGDSIKSFLSVGKDTVIYLAQGTYKLPYKGSSLQVKTGKVYGGFSGNESVIDLNARSLSDKDGNGIVEPWEFTNEAIITTSNPNFKFTGSGITDGTRPIIVTGTSGELNGVTISDLNYLSYAGPICVGLPAGSPTAVNNVSGKEGILRLCTVKRIKSYIGIVMSTNKYSIIDRCLIESNVVTANNSGGAVYMNLCGGKVTGCEIRNNAAMGSYGRGAGVWATSLSSTDMDAIVENSVIYNNYADANGNGAAIRADAQAGKRGIQIVNCTVVNNQTAPTAGTAIGSVELITNGLIANSIIVGDPSAEVRPNNANNYILNNIYGEYATGAATLNGSGNVTGKVTSDLAFKNPTLFAGVMIPDYTSSYDAAKYNAIRQANFLITSASSPAVITAGVSTLGASYTVSTTTTSISETVPSFDAYNVSRSGNITIGAYQFDNVAPTVQITSATSTTTASNPIPVIITFSENVTGFDVTDLVVTNGAAGSFVAVSPTVYTANITPADYGIVKVDVAQASATDGSGNGNVAATQFTRTYSNTTDLNKISASNIYVSSNDEIVIEEVLGKMVSVYSVTGALLHSIFAKDNTLSIPASKGIYIVSIGSQKSKVIVR